MSDKASPAFKRTADLITQELDKSLGSDPTYVRSIVLKLWPAANSQLRALTGVNASVELIYSPESNITASDVVAEVKKATECTDCPLAGGTFTDEDLCERNPCDENSTRCSSKDGTFNCTCLDGYVPTDLSTRVCHMGNTTTAPGTTTAAQGTTTVAPGTTTVAPGTTTAAPGSCASNPCGKGSTCEARANKGFVCLCLAGDNYNNKTRRCETAKVFPGHINLPDIVYDISMRDKTSSVFKETADLITQELDKSLSSDPTYVGSIVLELRSAGSILLRMSPGIDATVDIIYSPESDITASDVVAEVEKATECTDCPLKGATFVEEDLCESKACDEVTTRCSSGDGTFTCTCMDEYIPTDFSTRVCVACPSGQKAENSMCVSCPFGYSGFNCNESTMMLLVIVGSGLGGLLLIALILLIAVSSMKSSKKKKQAVTGMPHISQSPAKAPPANGQAPPYNRSAALANSGLPNFPRATPNKSWDNRTNLEMPSSNRQQNLNLNNQQYESMPYGQNHPDERSKSSGHHDVQGTPYMGYSPAKAPPANGFSVNSETPSFNRSAALDNGRGPSSQQPNSNNSLYDRTNQEMYPSNSRQNLVPMDANLNLNDQQYEMMPYGRSHPEERSKSSGHHDVRGTPYMGYSPAKAPPANDFTVNSETPSFNRSAAFANGRGPSSQQPNSNNSLYNRANQEMPPSNSRQNLVPMDANSRMNVQEDEMMPYGRSHPDERSKSSEHHDVRGMPYMGYSPAKAPPANDFTVNSETPSFNRSAALANGRGPSSQQPNSNNSLYDRTNQEMYPSNSRQNLVPMDAGSRMNVQEDEMMPYGRSHPDERSKSSEHQSAAFANAREPSFQQPKSNNSLYNRTNQEMYPSNSRQNLVPMDENLEDEMTPYGQSRLQNNPYGQSQGHTNHYYN
ncbi:uncharacterized protein LOC125022361 [Mugil cephalus]|uniref:uncharacterized protein LOC125022361 n=1 Tax=Mugil cephalus TaxID=48193 RepID=UPI001FB63432|nr:uncharacterized protein LOC125022361 [Mugil cephalus]